jgi:hypothetical protein
MPRYFFHLSRGEQVILDPEGTELADVKEARREAFLIARDVMIRVLKTAEAVPLDDYVQVVDEHGSMLHMVTLKEAMSGGGVS